MITSIPIDEETYVLLRRLAEDRRMSPDEAIVFAQDLLKLALLESIRQFEAPSLPTQMAIRH